MAVPHCAVLPSHVSCTHPWRAPPTKRLPALPRSHVAAAGEHAGGRAAPERHTTVRAGAWLVHVFTSAGRGVSCTAPKGPLKVSCVYRDENLAVDFENFGKVKATLALELVA